MQKALRSEKERTSGSRGGPSEAEEGFWGSIVCSELDSWYPQAFPARFQPARRRKPKPLRIGFSRMLSVARLARPWMLFRPSAGSTTPTRDP
jgi:hypothetical protein